MVRLLTFLALTILTVACATQPAAPPLVIADNAESVQPLAVGARVPGFTVYEVSGDAFNFNPRRLDRPAMFVVYRGGWCPYCNTQLSDLRRVLPELREMGVDVYFLSGDRPEVLYSSLKDETQEDIKGLDYVILSDAEMQAASAFQIAFRLDEGLVERIKAGLDVGSSSIDQHGALPVPAVIIVNTKGEVAYSFVEPDYKIRLPAREVKKAAERVLAAG